MKVVKSNVSILVQEPGIEGLFKLIERVGRLSYKSEDRITDTSYLKFIDMLKTRGHWAPFNLGAVYLKVPKSDDTVIKSLCGVEDSDWGKRPVFTRWVLKDDYFLFTTDYRTILQKGLEDVMEKYWEETPEHYHKTTTLWTCSRIISQQVFRHSIFRPIQESQRYVNYSLAKFNSEISYVVPQWVYRERDTYAPELKSLDIDDSELWKEMLNYSDAVRRRNSWWEKCEDEYMESIKMGLKPEEARGALCNDTSTTFAFSGFNSDWYYTPEQGSSEKAGFFSLRCAPDAQSDIRVLALDLKKQFDELGINNIK